ncbi:hypothetical protein, partial [Paraburkholderia sp.]|uniref:hypothetical protein n=1 Tax=Paraburkholderia sp. TaxID=1926495 RepID=UPI002AFFE646
MNSSGNSLGAALNCWSAASVRLQGSGSTGIDACRADLRRPTLPIPAETGSTRVDPSGAAFSRAGEEYEISVSDEGSKGAWRGLSLNIVFLSSVRVEAVIELPWGNGTRAYWMQ